MHVQIRNGEDTGVGFPGTGALLEVVHGRVAEGLPVAAGDQHRHFCHDHDRVDLASDGLEKEARSALAGGHGIVVGIVGVGDQRGGVSIMR